jgi:hypothetical protein
MCIVRVISITKDKKVNTRSNYNEKSVKFLILDTRNSYQKQNSNYYSLYLSFFQYVMNIPDIHGRRFVAVSWAR